MEDYEDIEQFEDFESFKKKVSPVTLKTMDDDFYDDLNTDELKSKEILGSVNLSNSFLQRRKATLLEDIIGAFPLIKDSYSNYEKSFWSEMAGDLDKEDAKELISFMEKKYSDAGYDEIEAAVRYHTPMFLTFALKNEQAWEAFHEALEASNISSYELSWALSKTRVTDPKYYPLMRNVFGDEFTDLYVRNKELIDRTPRKHNFSKLLENKYRQTNFLDSYTYELKNLTEAFGEDPDDYYCLSQAMEKEGFREAAENLLEKMLENKEIYTSNEENKNSNSFIKELFPDLENRVKKAFVGRLTDEDIQKISNRCFKEVHLLRLINRDSTLKNLDYRLINDILAANPDNIEQIKRTVEVFNSLNERPETYGSSYNYYYPNLLVPLIRNDVPEWMYKPLADALQERVFSTDRMGSVENLFDAAKTWKINPRIWKKEAKAIGKMPLETRVVASEVFNRISKSDIQDRKELKNLFWQEMKKAQDMGWKKALEEYISDDYNYSTGGRILSLYHPQLDTQTRKALSISVYPKQLINFDDAKLERNFELVEQYLSPINKQDLIGAENADGRISSNNKKLIQKIFNLEKLFKTEEETVRFLENISQNEHYTSRDALLWIPDELTEEKWESLSAFLRKNMYYDDGTGKMVLHDLNQLNDVCDIWKQLTPQQETFSFSKVLGLSYTQDTVKQINQQYYKPRNLNVPDNLRLYQKFLFIMQDPKTQEAVDQILSLNRKAGLRLIADTNDNTSESKLILTDLVIGNNANINKYERQAISHLDSHAILDFKSENYQNIMDNLMSMIANDPKAGELFRKHFIEITSDNTQSTNQKILDIRIKYHTNRDWLVFSAIKAMSCFGKDYQRYLKKIQDFNENIKKEQTKENPRISKNETINLHDALYWLPTNITGKDRANFIALIDKHFLYKDEHNIQHHRPFAEFEIIAKAWTSLSHEEQQLSYKDLLATIRAKKYTDCSYKEFGEEAARWGVPGKNYKTYENIYKQGLVMPELIDSRQRFTDGGNLVGRFLPRNDPRTGFFGQWTDCCQHFSGAGKTCAISSVRDPFSQLFVIEDKNGRIVAGSWVWESKFKQGDKYYKALCYDNIEAIGDYDHSQEVINIYKNTLPYLAKQNYAKVTVGMGYQDGSINEFTNDPDPVPLNKSYSGYTDAKAQKIMMKNPEAKPVDYNEGDIYVTGALEEDIPMMQTVSRICFPEGDRYLQLPDDPQGLVLKDKGKVVGYAVWSEEEHSIYDMAVLPEYRTDKNASSLKFLNEVVKKIRSLGGEWTAELRDNTSLRYMKAMAGRGLVNLSVGEIDHEMSDGSKVYKVKFSAVTEENRVPAWQRAAVNNDGR